MLLTFPKLSACCWYCGLSCRREQANSWLQRERCCEHFCVRRKCVITHQVAVMCFGHEKHSSHQVSGRNALRALTFTVTAFALHLFISVFTIYCQGDVIWKKQSVQHYLHTRDDSVSRNTQDQRALNLSSPPCTQKSQLCLSRVSRVVT